MDIFVSYRRDTGGQLAELLNEKFINKGVETFFDKNSIHNDDFLARIKRGIDNSPNFLMVLTPGYFVKRENEEDYVREEILYAIKQKKNFLAIASNDYNPNEINWDNECDEIKSLKTFDYKVYPSDGNRDMVDAFMKTYIKGMVDANGKRFSLKKEATYNPWYLNHEMDDEDTLWIKTDHVVCKSLDWEILEQAITKEGLFEGRDELNLYCLEAYDIETYKKKYDLNPRKKISKRITNVYGVTYEYLLDKADKVFGENHFLPYKYEVDEFFSTLETLLMEHQLDGFDIIDATLVIKDLPDPEKIVRGLVKYLNPEGGILYIRELDDDYIDGYPDSKGYIKKLKSILDLDDGAGNRHTGKKIYTFLKRAGAEKVFISDKGITTANHTSQFQHKMFETYFSYLIPELRALAEDTEENRRSPKYEKYVEAYAWLNDNYKDVESLFCSQDFYFRAGYVAGYGVFKADPELE